MAAHRSRTGNRAVRLLTALALAALATAALFYQRAVRLGEADLAARWFGLILNGHSQTVGDTIYFPWENGPLVGLRDTWECTVALLAAPLCGISAVLMAFSRIRGYRLLLGLIAALAAVISVNQLRLLMIALGLQRWGWSGYDIMHKVIGTLFALAGFAASLLLLLKVATGHRPRRA